jgi:adhesin transport system outer membrane protein
MDISRDYGDRLARLLEYVGKRADAGAASLSDMSRVKAREQESRSRMLEHESAHLAAGIEFVRLTNVVPQRVKIPEPGEVGGPSIPSAFEDAVARAEKTNPELRALVAELEAAELDRKAAAGMFLPRFDLEYSDNYSLHAGGEPSARGQRDRRLMLVMNWNLFDSGRDYLHREERAARCRELALKIDGERRRVAQELSANYATLATTRKRIAAGYRELAAIAAAARAMSERMLSGNQSLLDLLEVYSRYYRVRSRLVSLHVLEMKTVARLVRLISGVPESGPGR